MKYLFYIIQCFSIVVSIKMVQNVKCRSSQGWTKRINERIHVINSDYLLIGLKYITQLK